MNSTSKITAHASGMYKHKDELDRPRKELVDKIERIQKKYIEGDITHS